MSFPPDSFHNGWLWPLLLLALLPLVLHLLDRRRARRISWPAVRFFLFKGRRRVRWLQLKEALLIATRTAALLAFAYALMRPQSTIEVAASETPAARRGLVLVVDTSYSMAYRPVAAGPSLLKRAVASALRLVDHLRLGDEVVVLAGGGTLEEVTSDTLDLAAARRALLRLELSGGAFDLLGAVDRVAGAAARLPTLSRHAYLFTDLQASAVDADEGRWKLVRGRLREIRPEVHVTLVDSGDENAANRFPASLATEDLLASTHRSLVLTAEINSGVRPQPFQARFLADGKLLRRESLVPGSAGYAIFGPSLTHRFPTPGNKELRLEVDPDRLPEDDNRYLIVEVHDRVGVLILERRTDGQGTGRYVELALRPRAGDVIPEVVFDPRLVETVSRDRLEECRLLVMADVPRLTSEEAALIEEHTTGGGGLLVFAGPGVETSAYDRLLYRGGRGPLPARLLERTVVEDGSLHPMDLALSHPALSMFADRSRGDLGRVRIRAFWRVAIDPTSETSVLARAERASPWILERPFGRGRVALITTSALPGDSSLARTPLFLPLVQRLALYLMARGPGEQNVLVGESLRFPLPASLEEATAVVEDPAGVEHEATIARARGRLVAAFSNVQRPGVYRLQVTVPGKPSLTLLGAANVSADESLLERASAERIAWIEEAIGIERRREITALSTLGGTFRVEAEHWPHALALALLLLIVELCFLRNFARSRAPWRPAEREGA